MHLHEVHPKEATRIARAIGETARRIAPVWPLANFVAVNPYMGFVDSTFDQTAQRFRQTHGAELTMPVEFYLERLEDARITLEDVEESLVARGHDEGVEAFLERVLAPKVGYRQLDTVSDLGARLSGIDVARLMTDQVSRFASSYFDEGQASWASPFMEHGIYEAWRAEAEIDRTPGIMGVKSFRRYVSELPEDPQEAVVVALRELSVSSTWASTYLQALSSKAAGWLAYAARVSWDDRLYRDRENAVVEDLLAVLISWEYAVYRSFSNDRLEGAWRTECERIEEAHGSIATDDDLEMRLVLQQALEIASERKLVQTFAGRKSSEASNRRPLAQVIFCIDVRSEIFRRNLEEADSRIDTLGFAGFFGMPIRFRELASENQAEQCPALVNPCHDVEETFGGIAADEKARARRHSRHKVHKIWKSFASGAVSCFGFVSPLGLTRLPKLFTDAFGFTRPVADSSKRSLTRAEVEARDVDISGIDHDSRIELAANTLSGMSLTNDFARLVVIAGHGASMVNNPHASGYDCGACGGRSGEPNARVAAAILNDAGVRAELADRGIEIPTDTIFVAGLHDTTTDEVELFSRNVPGTYSEDLKSLRTALNKAAHTSREERAPRLGIDGDIDRVIRSRTRDWAQVRPEWGLAGCSSFIVAPRARTRNIDLDGKAFLHDYAWKADERFEVLESIMTAPLVVTSWINLQYYASTVDNRVFGAGNKTLHNVVGTVGVLEGQAGDLRVGLPWQSVHDGSTHQHDPIRLRAVIEAPIEAMNQVISKHQSIRDLCENGWLHLYAMDENGEISHRYEGALHWSTLCREARDELRASA